jgi:glutathione S-transferase
MITLHHLEKSRSQRVLWLLEELGVPYEIKRYARDPKTLLAPASLKAVHPLGKSPVITDDGITVAESAAILEYLAERYAPAAGQGSLMPETGAPGHLEYRYWMHYAEGSLMPPLVMKLVFMTIPTQPMPFFVRPIARQLCQRVQQTFIDPNLLNHLQFMEAHLSRHAWFAGDAMTLADIQMSFPVLASLSRQAKGQAWPHLRAFMDKVEARPAYQRALAKGGPVLL